MALLNAPSHGSGTDDREFVARVRAAGVPTTVRDTRGQDIDGACGQLAAADQPRPEARPERARGEEDGAVPLGAESDQ